MSVDLTANVDPVRPARTCTAVRCGRSAWRTRPFRPPFVGWAIGERSTSPEHAVVVNYSQLQGV